MYIVYIDVAVDIRRRHKCRCRRKHRR